MQIDLVLVAALIVAFGVIMYVILDGFDLGIGILFPFMPKGETRDVMMDSIAPIWDGNETWLVLGGALLYGAFPLAYSTLLPVLYVPIMMMLISLVFRGVAFEFRAKADKSKFIWDFAFAGGSFFAAFCQGMILGTFVIGYAVESHPTISGYYQWLTPFSLMTGAAVVMGYALLGSTWLIMKTTDILQASMFHTARILLYFFAVFGIIVSLWSPFIDPAIFDRWFSLPNFFFLLPLPILAGTCWLYALYSLNKGYENLPFILTICLFILCYIGLGISSWPYIVPRNYTIWDAATNLKSLKFVLVGAVILLPVLTGYSIYAYYIFRGKVKPGQGYH